MLNRKHLHWAGVLLASTCLVLLAGGCPTPSRPAESASTPPEPPAEVDPAEVAQSLANDAPTADAGRDQTVTAGQRVILRGTGSSDPDGDHLSYEWHQIAGSPSIEFITKRYASIAEFETPFDLTEEVTLTFVLVVSDGYAFATDRVHVTIRPAE